MHACPVRALPHLLLCVRAPLVPLRRSVRMALWDYKPNSALTAACDAAVVDFCPKVRDSC